MGSENQEAVRKTGQPSDRRKEIRQGVDTSAVLHLVDLGAKMPGRILDLSPGGCRIRTDDRFLLGIFRRVETEFRLEGLPIRLGGVTQAIYDRHNVGIRFLDLSQRKQEQLMQLIKEIHELREAEKSAEPPAALLAPEETGESATGVKP